MGNEGKVAALAEGALLAALTAVLVLTGYFIPPLQIFTNIIWTVPIVVLIVRRDLRLGIMATFVAGFVIAMFIGPINALLLFTQFAALGLVYGYLFKNKVRATKAVVIGAGVSLVSLALNFYLVFKLTGLPFSDIFQEMEGTVNYAMDFYRRTGMLESMLGQGMTLEQIQQTLSNMLNIFKVLLPGIFITASLLAAFINYLVAEKVLQRLQLIEKKLPPFRYWQLPWYFVWGLIIGLSCWQLGDHYQLDILKQVGLNLLYIYLPLLAGNGLAAASFIFYRFKISLFLRVTMIIVALLNLPLVLIATVMLGAFDPFLSYRRAPELPNGNDKGE